MKTVKSIHLTIRFALFFVGMMGCGVIYADNSANQAENQYPVVAAVNMSAAEPVSTTNGADNTSPQGAMTITQPTLGAPSSVTSSTEDSRSTIEGNSDKVASSWASLDENNTNTSSLSSTEADAEVAQSDNNGNEADNAGSDNTVPVQTVSPAADSTPDDEGDEHVIWNKRPINFVIPTGKERMISFPTGIATISADDKLTSDKLTLVYNEGTLYLKALQSFEPLLVIVHLKDSPERVLMYVSSSNAADDTPVDVVISNGSTHSSTNQTTESALNYVDLMRFAIEQLYSPERLISEPADIARAPMLTTKSVSLLYGHNTQAFPEVSWRGGDDFVTAVLIKNTQSRALTLDPRNLKGQWLASSFYPTNVLAPRGQRGDETTLFVISDVPFGQAYADMPIGGQ